MVSDGNCHALNDNHVPWYSHVLYMSMLFSCTVLILYL